MQNHKESILKIHTVQTGIHLSTLVNWCKGSTELCED